MSFWAEFKRRNVIRVGAVYLAAAWVISQVGDVVAQAFSAPSWAMRALLVMLALGLPVALVLSWLFELTPEGVKLTREVAPEASIAAGTGRRLDRVLIGMIALLIVVLIADNWLLPAREAPPASVQAAPLPAMDAATTAGTPQARLANSVAVLPFANMSPSAENAYFAAGIHEEVLNSLAKVSALNVIGRTSMLRYEDTRLTMREIADELNVETIMEGSVRYAGTEVRITAQLIDPTTGAHLWSEAYQRKIDDIFAIQADIAMNIANAIGAEFSVAEQNALETPPTTSPAAYALYLQASDQVRATLLGSTQAALTLLDRAIAIDPEFAAAYAAKAAQYSSMFVNTVQSTAVAAEGRADLERLVRENADRAVALDPESAVARLALRAINGVSWRWANYAQTLDPAEERALSTANLWLLSWMGNQATALRISEQNAVLGPNDPAAYLSLGIVQAYGGDRTASIRSLNRSLELAPASALSRAWLGYDQIALGNDAAALAELQLLERMLGVNRPIVFLPELAYAYSRLGRTDDVARLFAEIEARAAQLDVGVGTWAMAYLARGDEQEALRQLEAAAVKARNYEPDQGYLHLMNLKMNFLADPRLEEPRFSEVLSRVRGN